MESDPSLCRLNTNFNKSVENLSQLSEEKFRKRSAGSLSNSFRFSSVPTSHSKMGQNLGETFDKIQNPNLDFNQVKTPPIKPKRKNAVSPLVIDLSRLNENASQNL